MPQELDLVDLPGEPALDIGIPGVFATSAARGAHLIGVTAASVERCLGAPPIPVTLQSLPGDPEAEGLTELELEVLQDEIDISQRSFVALTRRWRLAVGREGLAAVRQRAADAGVTIACVSWPDLAVMPDDEIAYACEMTRALGATQLTTRFTTTGPARLATFAERYGVLIGFDPCGPLDLEAAFAGLTHVGPIVDLVDDRGGRRRAIRVGRSSPARFT